MDEIIYGEPLGPRVVFVEPMENFILRIKFNNGEIRFFDTKKIYNLKCFKPLQNKEFFNKVHVAFGSISWNNDIDYCPDCLYEESTSFLE